MANEKRIYENWIGGLVEDNPLASGATTLTSAGLAGMPAVGATEHMLVVFDPDGLTGAPFAKRVTAHTAAATTATIEAAAVIGTARQIDRDVPWVHTMVADDVSRRHVSVRKIADESVTSSTAIQDDNELTFSVLSGEVWVGRFVLFYTGDPAGDLLTAISTPAGSTGFRGSHGYGVAATSSTDALARWVAVTTITGTTDTGNTIGSPVAGTPNVGIVEFSVVAGANGAITFRWAQGTSHATATIVKAGSYLTADRMFA